MQALYLANGQLNYRADIPRPEAGPGQALIRVNAAGICATDLELVKGYAGFEGIPGHEFVGQVEAVHDSQDAAWIGRRVVGEINLGCGQCAYCLGPGSEHCPQRTVLGIVNHPGVFADYLTLPIRNLHAVPDTLPDEVAVFTEPVAAALRIREQVAVKPSQRTAVIGPGRLGLLIGQVLAMHGVEVTMLGRSPASLQLPAQLGLATGLVNEYGDDAFDLVVEATGSEAGLSHALRLTRPLGTLIMKSTYAGQANVDLTKLVVDEITVIGSRCGPFAPALRLLAAGQIQVEPLIEARYSLADGLAAFAHAAQPGVRKILLHCH